MKKFFFLFFFMGMFSLLLAQQDNQIDYKLIYTFVDKDTQEPLDGINVRVLNLKDSSEAVTVTGKDGQTLIYLPASTDFLLRAYNKRYFSSDTLTISTHSEAKTLQKIVSLEKIRIGVVRVLKGVSFAPNQESIMPRNKVILRRLADKLRQNPSVEVEIAAHTDARGDDEKNLQLSERQANAIKNYLVEQGADSENIQTRGFGETQLLNHCKNDVLCTSEEHLRNRRVEYVIIGVR